jgi:hypothetical protein
MDVLVALGRLKRGGIVESTFGGLFVRKPVRLRALAQPSAVLTRS